jgi:hypothetical protein
MPVDDLAPFEVLSASDGPEGTAYDAVGGTHNTTAADWEAAVAALWRTPMPRVIVVTPGFRFTIVGGAGLAIVPTNATAADRRAEVYRCRADPVIVSSAHLWEPASPTMADDAAAGPADRCVDAYVVSADPAYRAGGSAAPFWWLTVTDGVEVRADPTVEGHRRRWRIADASRVDVAESFPLAHKMGTTTPGTGGGGDVRTAGRVGLLRPSGGGALRCYRLCGHTPLLGVAPTDAATDPRRDMAYGWMFQHASEPLLRSDRFLSAVA